MKAREYDVLSRAVEEGVAYGWRRAHKHESDPAEDTIQNQIITAVLTEITQWFQFDDGLDEADPT